MKTLLNAIAMLSFLATVGAARAQEATNMSADERHSLTLEAGLDSAVEAAAGYSYRLQSSLWKHDLVLFGKLGFPVARLDLSDSSVEAGARSTALAYGNLRLQVVLGAVLRNTSNALFDANSVGASAALLPGYQSARWGLMAELGYEKMLLTNIRHSDLYQDTYYTDAKSGWFRDTAGTIRVGARAGVRIGQTQLSLRFGAMASEGGAPHLPPFYGAIGTSYAF